VAANLRERPDTPCAGQILIVEDEFLIAMELASTLRKAGFQVIGPAASVAEAMHLIEHQRPDAAVLNVNLGGERVTPVAKLLRARSIPFVLASAYDEATLSRDSALIGAINVGRPTKPDDLRDALLNLIAGRRDRRGGTLAGV